MTFLAVRMMTLLPSPFKSILVRAESKDLQGVNVMRMSFAHGVAAMAIAVSSLSGAAQAQEAAPASTQTDSNLPGQDATPGSVQDSSNAGQTSDVVVTGSRIRRQDFSTPSPIVTLDSKTFEAQGTTNVTDFLRAYPRWSVRAGRPTTRAIAPGSARPA